MSADAAWWDIGLRLLCGFAAGAVLGYDREERGRVAGLRTMILVCLAATAAMIEADLLLGSSGAVGKFVRADVLRLPLGILSGIGFIGAGAIVRKPDIVWGVTTAAMLWMVTVIGLVFGAGFYALGAGVTALSFAAVWGLRHVEARLSHIERGHLTLTLGPSGLSDGELGSILAQNGFAASGWNERYDSAGRCVSCRLQWSSGDLAADPRALMRQLASRQDVQSVDWRSHEMP